MQFLQIMSHYLLKIITL